MMPRLGLGMDLLRNPPRLSLLLVACALALIYSDALWRWDRLFYDWNLRFWSRPAPTDVVIVAIDERSLQELGVWPWPRHLHAALIDRLTAAGAKAIALDVTFAEPSLNDPTADAALARALKANGRVVLPVLPQQVRVGGQLLETLPTPALAEAAAGFGHVDVDLDLDGIVRGTHLQAGLGSPYWPTLALALLSVAAPLDWPTPARGGSGALHTWNRAERILIPFAGPPGHFQHVSYVDAVRGELPVEHFRDRYILIGTTAAGLWDVLPTPVSGHNRPMPGIEFNANVLDALRNGLIIRPLDERWRLLLTVGLVLLPGFIYTLWTPRWTLLSAALLLVLAGAVSVVLLRGFQVWFAPAPALFALGLSYPLWSWRRLVLTLRSLFEEKERAQVTLHSIGDAVLTTDARGQVEYMNPLAETLTGYPVAEARGQRLSSVLNIVNEQSRVPLADPVDQCLRAGKIIKLADNSTVINRSGQEYAIRASAGPMRDEAGRLQGVVLAISDITEARSMAQQLAYQATHDTLTRLPNRHLLKERLEHALAHAHRGGGQLAVLAVDLDRFKAINDGLGHAAGDELLKAVAERLPTVVQEDDTVARPGGDEFTILAENLPRVERAALLARTALDALGEAFTVARHELVVSASIGISLFPKDGADAETLLQNADAAMRRAKRDGGNTFQFYAEDMNNRVLERLLIERDLRRALERDELELFYQPQVELDRCRIVGAETLLRWRHPERGLVPPATFIPLAEETGLIIPIGEWTLRAACRQVKDWQAAALPTPRVAVNLSPRQFSQPGIARMVARVLMETGLDPSYLDLEITESLLMTEDAIATLHALKAMGLQLAIDDFGTGYSNLNYLRRMPVDWLKIDQSFVRDIKPDSDDGALAAAVLAIAHGLRLKVIAEGVENRVQWAYLKSRRCEVIQGAYISLPVPAGDMTALLRAQPLIAPTDAQTL